MRDPYLRKSFYCRVPDNTFQRWLLKLLSHIHDFYQDLNTTKLDLKVVLGRAASWQNIQIYVLREILSYDRHTTIIRRITTMCVIYTMAIRLLYDPLRL